MVRPAAETLYFTPIELTLIFGRRINYRSLCAKIAVGLQVALRKRVLDAARNVAGSRIKPPKHRRSPSRRLIPREQSSQYSSKNFLDSPNEAQNSTGIVGSHTHADGKI
jgi:hypothetical protein